MGWSTTARSENTNENVPNAYGVPLKGEWTWCVSSKASDLKGNANAFNAAIEHADGSDESTETANTKDIKSEGCEGGMDERASVDEADGGIGWGVEPMSGLSELETLVTTSAESEDLGSGGIPCVCLGNQVDGSRDHTDVSTGQTDAPCVETDAITAADTPQIVRIP